MERFTNFILICIMIIFIMTIGGYTFSVMWNWLLVPIFNVKELSVIHSIGINLFTVYFRIKIKTKSKDDEEFNAAYVFKSLLYQIMYSVIFISFAWIVKFLYIQL